MRLTDLVTQSKSQGHELLTSKNKLMVRYNLGFFRKI